MSTVPEEATQSFASTPDDQLGHLLEQHILCDVGHQSPQGALLREAIRRLKDDRLSRPGHRQAMVGDQLTRFCEEVGQAIAKGSPAVYFEGERFVTDDARKLANKWLLEEMAVA